MRKTLLVAAVLGLATIGGNNVSAQPFPPGFFPFFTGGLGQSPIFGQPVINIPRTGGLLGIVPITQNRPILLNRADNAFFGAFGISRISFLFGL